MELNMGIFFTAVKSFVFIFNLACFILGMNGIAVGSLGLEEAEPGTEEHTYFIITIILGALVCMATLLGCYGVVCELLGVNLIYVFFLLTLFVIQYLQMRSFQPNSFFRHGELELEKAWQMIETKPYLMEAIETNYNCCGLYDWHDYTHMEISIPKSCYPCNVAKDPSNIYAEGCADTIDKSHDFAVYRERVAQWSLYIAELLSFIYSLILSAILVHKRQTRRRIIQRVRGYVNEIDNDDDFEPEPEPYPYGNHIGSRTNLLSS